MNKTELTERIAKEADDVLRGMLEDARRYQVLAEKAAADPDQEAVSGALKEIERLGHSQARQAERLLAQRTAG